MATVPPDSGPATITVNQNLSGVALITGPVLKISGSPVDFSSGWIFAMNYVPAVNSTGKVASLTWVSVTGNSNGTLTLGFAVPTALLSNVNNIAIYGSTDGGTTYAPLYNGSYRVATI